MLFRPPFLTTDKNADDKEPAPPPRYETGNPYLDHGPVCEREGNQGKCFLGSSQRARVIERIGWNLGAANQNYMTALEHARVEALLHEKTGWGPVGELLFSLAVSAVTAGIGLVVGTAVSATLRDIIARNEKAAQEIVKAHQDATKGLVKQAASALKSTIKDSFGRFPPEVAAKGQFILALKNSVTQVSSAIRDTALNTGDDAQLVTLAAGAEPDILTLAHYTQQVAELLARFDASHIAEIGPRKQGPVVAGTTETVLVAAGGYSRFAIVKFGERKVLGRSRGDTWHTDAAHYFVRFVDDDLTDAAVAAQKQNVGNIKVIVVGNGHNFEQAAELDAWIESVRAPRPHGNGAARQGGREA